MNSIDISIFRAINGLAKSLSFLNPIMIFIAEFLPFLIAGLMLAKWFVNDNKIRTRKMLICAFVSFAIAMVICKLCGVFIDHPQPFVSLENVNKLIHKTPGNSFPSDHTSLFFATLYTFFMFSKSKYKFLYVLLAILGGISRIWVGVHYPIDVIVAAVIGTMCAIVVVNTLGKSKLLNDTVIKINKFGANLLASNK
ncbi:undecaprenyl-diphosphatase [Mycoplasma sp. P36-A1]|uniref:undecaprenyl-diphosphatase n=1 Tax=Mycoplasma sp. P36-A1 TaxID=3252900 RepID=UPI003C2CF365